MLHRFQVVPAAYLVLRRTEDPSPSPADLSADSATHHATEQVLLQLRRGTGYFDEHWACAAAGHVEAGESVFGAVCREAREELGIHVEAANLVPLCGMHRTGGNGHAIDERADFFFSCTRWSGEPALQEADKAADLRWFALDALPDPLVPHERYVLDRLRSGDLPSVVAYGF